MNNVILVMLDSLRRDHVGCYGNDWIETPNLDDFAKDCVIFDNAYPEGLPTIPVRTALITGQYTLPYRPWQPLTEHDIPAAEILYKHGFTNAFITDTYHVMKPNMNFHRGFHAYRWIRGQEADAYETKPHGKNLSNYSKPAMEGDRIMVMLDQYLRNTQHFKTQENYFAAQVFQEVICWLEGSHMEQPFFLWVDSFDPHEPWDPPPEYREKYTDPNYKGPHLIHPKYGPVDWMTEEELNYVRALYAEEVMFVDYWFGRFMDRVRELGVYEDSLIVVLSDHGHPHGDHGTIMKTDANLYSELLRIPLLIKAPRGQYAGKRVEELVQVHDILPTIFSLLDLEHETISMHGKNMWPLVTGEIEKLRGYVVMGYHESVHRCVRDKEWSYIRRPEGQQNELYNMVEDPREKTNLIEKYPEKAKELASKLGRYFEHAQPVIATVQLKYEVSFTRAG